MPYNPLVGASEDEQQGGLFDGSGSAVASSGVSSILPQASESSGDTTFNNIEGVTATINSEDLVTLTFTFTDGTTTTATFTAPEGPRGTMGTPGNNGTDGNDGADGISITDVTIGTGVAQSDGSVSYPLTFDRSGGADDIVVNFSAPRGPAGADGADGQDGASITAITATDVVGGTQVTITAGSVSRSFTVADGAAGAPGEKGDQGDEGPPGIQGPPGPTGPQGNTGAPGNDGNTGPRGPVGPAGQDGDNGADGADGQDGASLTGITSTQVTNGVEVTLTAGSGSNTITNTFTVPRGPAGTNGTDGTNGRDGEDGDDGITPNINVVAVSLPSDYAASVTRTGSDANPTISFGIPRGAAGPQGPEGPTGAAGTQVTANPTGSDGDNLTRISIDGTNYNITGSGGGGGGATNLNAAATGTSLTIESSSGNNASIPAATTSAWGAMTDEDKTKLDGIATGATNYASATFAGQTDAGNYTVPVRDSGNTTTKFLREDGDWVVPPDTNTSYTFTDTANNGTTLGVDFTESSGTVTATVDASGIGGNPSLPSEHARITLSSTSFEQTNSTVTITGTVSVASPYTFAGTGSQNGTGGTETLTVSNSSVTISGKTGVTDATFSLSIPASVANVAGSFTVNATVYATYNSITYHETVSVRVTITAPIPHFYVAQLTSVPANNAAMTDAGNFTNGVSHTFTATESGGRTAYVALPTRSGGYNFQSGSYYLTATTVSSGYSQTGYTLYSLADVSDGTGKAGTYIFTIREA